MKPVILVLAMFYFTICNGQEIPCDSGFKRMPTIGTAGLLIHADTCLPDSVCKRLWNEFNKSACEETSFGMVELGGNGSLSFSENHEWTDSLGCKITYEYMVMRKNKWVNITVKEYKILIKKRK